MKPGFLLLFQFIFIGSFAAAQNFKDCTRLQESCFDAKNVPAEPFVMRAPTQKLVILVHGLSDSPYTFKDEAIFLNSLGYNVYAVLLTGHGHKDEDLFYATAGDWVRDAQLVLAHALQETHAPKAILMGFSMGGAVVAKIAEDPKWNRHVSALILQAPAFEIRSRAARWLCEVGLATSVKKWAFEGKEVQPLVQYGKLAMPAVCELTDLGAVVRSGVDKINVPVFMTVSEYDQTISTETALFELAQMSSPLKRAFYIRKSVTPLSSAEIQFIQVVAPETKHSDINFLYDPIRKLRNPVYNQMIQQIGHFLETMQ